MATRKREPAVAIRLLGSPEVVVAGRPLEVDTRKAVAILAVLATDGRAYGREELATLLWPDSDDASARGALRRTLSVLRGAVGGEVLRVDRQQVALVHGRYEVDVARLEALSASGDQADLAAAADLARGPFMAGFTLRDSLEFDDWRAARSVAIERNVSRVLDRLIDALENKGDVVGAIAAAGRRIDHDPLDESAHVRRMELLAAGGDRAGAVRQYRACVAVLERELGVQPLPETTARYEAIRDGQVPAATVAPPPASDSQQLPAIDPERLPLVGREDVLTEGEAVRRASTPNGRVLVLAGEPGIGKSRLALAITERARSAGANVLMTSAYAAEQRIAYGPIVGALEGALADDGQAARVRALGEGIGAEVGRIVPGFATPGARRAAEVADASTVQARLLAAIADALTAALAGSTPGVLVIDDVHWADGGTIAALAYLLRRLTGRPLLVVLTWRDEDLAGDARLVAELAEERAGGAVFRLGRLARDDVAAFVDAAGASPAWSVDALWDASEGLPLYIASALATAPDPDAINRRALPSGVRAVLSERLVGLEGVPAQVLAAAAAIGRAFEVPTLRHASGRTEDEVLDALDALAARGLIRESGDADGQPAYDFTHGALRELSEEST